MKVKRSSHPTHGQPRSITSMHVAVCCLNLIGVRGPLDNPCVGYSRWAQPLTHVHKSEKQMLGYLANASSLYRRSLGLQGRGSLCGCRRCWARCLMACLGCWKRENCNGHPLNKANTASRGFRCRDCRLRNHIKM